MIIDVESPSGVRQEIHLEEEDGVTVIEIRDWEEGGAIAEVTFDGTLQEFKDKVAQG